VRSPTSESSSCEEFRSSAKSFDRKFIESSLVMKQDSVLLPPLHHHVLPAGMNQIAVIGVDRYTIFWK
jgi:hypothetical protein